MSGDPLKFEWKGDNVLHLSGSIDESFDSAGVVRKIPEYFYLDMKKVKRINSSGVRQWIRFISSLNRVNACYVNVACPVVEQFSMVPEFIGENNYVKSFDARYVCERCNLSEIHTLVVGVDVLPNQPEYNDAPQRMCKQCKEPMEFDHNPESYFYFLTDLQKDPNQFGQGK